MKLIYIAGPYRAATEHEIWLHIEAARAKAIELMRLGYGVIVPHMNTAHLGGAVPDEQFVEQGMEMARRSDAVFLLVNWKKSSGSRAEYNAALTANVPLYEDVGTLLADVPPIEFPN